MTERLEIHPLTAARWPDLVDLFERPGPRGAWPRTSACYCMFWRLPSAEYDAAFRQRSLENVSGGPNKDAMKRLVAGGIVPGLLAYRESQAVGWVAVSPRAELVRLETSPGLRSDEERPDEPAWSVSCFYVHRSEWGTESARRFSRRRSREHSSTALRRSRGIPCWPAASTRTPGTTRCSPRRAFGLCSRGEAKGARSGAVL